MMATRPCPVPDGSLLSDCRDEGSYTDCYVTEVAVAISHEDFVAAFYTTALFKLERWILAWLVAKPSTDAQAARLARGEIDGFAAWSVQRRAPDQLLLVDFQGRTKSWLMVQPVAHVGGAMTRLYFGSAIVPERDRGGGERRLGRGFRALLGFHRIYSILLLRAAKARLLRSLR